MVRYTPESPRVDINSLAPLVVNETVQGFKDGVKWGTGFDTTGRLIKVGLDLNYQHTGQVPTWSQLRRVGENSYNKIIYFSHLHLHQAETSVGHLKGLDLPFINFKRALGYLREVRGGRRFSLDELLDNLIREVDTDWFQSKFFQLVGTNEDQALEFSKLYYRFNKLKKPKINALRRPSSCLFRQPFCQYYS